MLHRKEHNKDQVLELVSSQSKETISAVVDYVVDELEESSTELGVLNEVVLNHAQSL